MRPGIAPRETSPCTTRRWGLSGTTAHATAATMTPAQTSPRPRTHASQRHSPSPRRPPPRPAASDAWRSPLQGTAACVGLPPSQRPQCLPRRTRPLASPRKAVACAAACQSGSAHTRTVPAASPAPTNSAPRYSHTLTHWTHSESRRVATGRSARTPGIQMLTRPSQAPPTTTLWLPGWPRHATEHMEAFWLGRRAHREPSLASKQMMSPEKTAKGVWREQVRGGAGNQGTRVPWSAPTQPLTCPDDKGIVRRAGQFQELAGAPALHRAPLHRAPQLAVSMQRRVALTTRSVRSLDGEVSPQKRAPYGLRPRRDEGLFARAPEPADVRVWEQR